LATAGRSSTEIATAAAAGDITALWLVHTDPVRDSQNKDLWIKAIAKAGLVIAHASTLSPELAEHANVVFPAESGAEREGTITHPDGRVQRLRKAIGAPEQVKPAGAVIARIAEIGSSVDLGASVGPAATEAVARAVPFYEHLTAEEIGGRGVRWQEREAAANLQPGSSTGETVAPQPAASPNGALRLGTFRSIWAAPEVEISPALKFLSRTPSAELSPEDAQRLGVTNGNSVEVAGVSATARIRSDVPTGNVFIESGVAGGASLPADGELVEVKPR
jgi:NADH-quinone oxidoreductase subunit G